MSGSNLRPLPCWMGQGCLWIVLNLSTVQAIRCFNREDGVLIPLDLSRVQGWHCLYLATLFASILEISVPENSQVHCVLIQAKYYATKLFHMYQIFYYSFLRPTTGSLFIIINLPEGNRPDKVYGYTRSSQHKDELQKGKKK
ncbi:hypothetical protein AVEN_110069-1 [Araneus ventricosus]|uniref:Uncharacterized protein n=1 Tax=Araneus ventricosus TaxID=182803 RepID=A0A4Y2DFU6_ARAVE|nr:hypothetical protein AVEN_110069-1 [Araneus ventricosus]